MIQSGMFQRLKQSRFLQDDHVLFESRLDLRPPCPRHRLYELQQRDGFRFTHGHQLRTTGTAAASTGNALPLLRGLCSRYIDYLIGDILEQRQQLMKSNLLGAELSRETNAMIADTELCLQSLRLWFLYCQCL